MRTDKPLSTREPISPIQRRHRHQAAWQIWVPLGLCLLLIVAGGVLITLPSLRGGASVRQFADVSTILLVLPLLAILLVSLAALAALIYLMVMVSQKLPSVAQKTQIISSNINQLAKGLSTGAVEPILRGQQGIAGITRFFKILAGKGK